MNTFLVLDSCATQNPRSDYHNSYLDCCFSVKPYSQLEQYPGGSPIYCVDYSLYCFQNWCRFFFECFEFVSVASCLRSAAK